MWRTIKKLYFKLYHLFKLIGILILLLIPNIVKAEVYDSCFNQYKSGNYEVNRIVGNQVQYKNLIEVTPGEYVYIKFFTGETNLEYGNNNVLNGTQNAYDENGNWVVAVSPGSTWDKSNQIVRIKIESNWTWMKYISLSIDARSNYSILAGTPVVSSIGTNELLECPEEPDPPTPPQPEEDVYTNFVSLYIDKIQSLANETIENKYLLTTIGIIIGFIVLELFLKMLKLRRGRK